MRDARTVPTRQGRLPAAITPCLADRGLVDFSRLEQAVLDRFRSGEPREFLERLQAVFVDECQDTNLLQDALYMEMAQACGGALTVVGDDDQSLYRFRGATVDLFTTFPVRYARRFRCPAQTIFLKRNYRSTRPIVCFVNEYVGLDPGYQLARVANKPPLVEPVSGPEDLPVLGLFRDTPEEVADEVTHLIRAVFRGPGYRLPNGAVITAGTEGDLGDGAFLCASPREFSAGGKPRLPLLLRDRLRNLRQPADVFNPRGQEMASIPLAQILGGLLLLCLDPNQMVQADAGTALRGADAVFRAWRDAARTYLPSDKALAAYVTAWSKRRPRPGTRWPRSVAMLKLLYALAHHFPELHDDPEGQIYLEVFARQAEVAARLGKFKAEVVEDSSNPSLGAASVREMLVLLLAPIAEGAVGVSEDLMDAFPRNRLAVLSIHQAKGLEFPLAIVDVGTDFKTNHHAQKLKRFPETPSMAHRLEDLGSSFRPLQLTPRGGVDRAFDDLCRTYFVAFSRPQQVLLLVGLSRSCPSGCIPNVATGWRRKGGPAWSNSPPYLAL